MSTRINSLNSVENNGHLCHPLGNLFFTWLSGSKGIYRMSVSDLRGCKDAHPQVNFFQFHRVVGGGGNWGGVAGGGQNNWFMPHLWGRKCEKIWQWEHYAMFLGSTRLVKHWTNSCLIVSELDLWLRCTKTTDGNLCRWHRWGALHYIEIAPVVNPSVSLCRWLRANCTALRINITERQPSGPIHTKRLETAFHKKIYQ